MNMRDELLRLADWCDTNRTSPTTADLRAIAGAGPGDRLAEYNRADEAEVAGLLKQVEPWTSPTNR